MVNWKFIDFSFFDSAEEIHFLKSIPNRLDSHWETQLGFRWKVFITQSQAIRSVLWKMETRFNFIETVARRWEIRRGRLISLGQLFLKVPYSFSNTIATSLFCWLHDVRKASSSPDFHLVCVCVPLSLSLLGTFLRMSWFGRRQKKTYTFLPFLFPTPNYCLRTRRSSTI